MRISWILSFILIVSTTGWSAVGMDDSTMDILNFSLCHAKVNGYNAHKEQEYAQLIEYLQQDRSFPMFDDDQFGEFHRKSQAQLEKEKVFGREASPFVKKATALNSEGLSIVRFLKKKYASDRSAHEQLYRDVETCALRGESCEEAQKVVDDFNQKLMLLRMYLKLSLNLKENPDWSHRAMFYEVSDSPLEPLSSEEEEIVGLNPPKPYMLQHYYRIAQNAPHLLEVTQRELTVNSIYESLKEQRERSFKKGVDEISDPRYFHFLSYLVEYAHLHNLIEPQNIERRYQFCAIAQSMQKVPTPWEQFTHLVGNSIMIGTGIGVGVFVGRALGRLVLSSLPIWIGLSIELAVDAALVFGTPLFDYIFYMQLVVEEWMLMGLIEKQKAQCFLTTISDYKANGYKDFLKHDVGPSDRAHCQFLKVY